MPDLTNASPTANFLINDRTSKNDRNHQTSSGLRSGRKPTLKSELVQGTNSEKVFWQDITSVNEASRRRKIAEAALAKKKDVEDMKTRSLALEKEVELLKATERSMEETRKEMQKKIDDLNGKLTLKEGEITTKIGIIKTLEEAKTSLQGTISNFQKRDTWNSLDPMLDGVLVHIVSAHNSNVRLALDVGIADKEFNPAHCWEFDTNNRNQQFVLKRTGSLSSSPWTISSPDGRLFLTAPTARSRDDLPGMLVRMLKPESGNSTSNQQRWLIGSQEFGWVFKNEYYSFVYLAKSDGRQDNGAPIRVMPNLSSSRWHIVPKT